MMPVIVLPGERLPLAELWAISACARHARRGVAEHTVGFVRAATENGALTEAMQWAINKWPPREGWDQHDVRVESAGTWARVTRGGVRCPAGDENDEDAE